ncbi:hypothetical protein [Streptomyces laurentii]|uniref:hypothetical protein n=1 Tax=Streptomyces laurentii TaxID=39478 RepID=UPI00368351C1
MIKQSRHGATSFARSSSMRFTAAVATSLIAFGALLSGFTASSDAPQTVQHNTAASSPLTGTIVHTGTPDDDHGNA